jgi:putative transposase
MGYVLYMTSPTFHDPAVVLQTMRMAMSASRVAESAADGARSRRGIYTPDIVASLMIYQRLNSKRTLASAVQWIVRHAKEVVPPARRCKRIADGRISTSTGGYCQARQNMTTLVASDIVDHVFEQLQTQIRAEMPQAPRPVFVIDGSSLRMPHGNQLRTAFPPGRNQHGENHWPVMRIVVFHDVHTGIATRPSWGPMYGDHSASEQALAQSALNRLPADAIVLADANFGIFSFAYAVDQTQRAIIVRLTASRAGKVLQHAPPSIGRRRKVTWEPSRWDRQAHPDLPAGASVQGWLVSCRNPANRSEILYFFTTLDEKPSRILAIYGLRWHVETDLRSLKSTVGLHQLRSTSPTMAEKELLMAVAAYNVVRAVMSLAAHQAGISPRQLSFSTAQDAVMAAWSDLQRAESEAQFRAEMKTLLALVARAKLPRRRRKRSYPREVWGRGGHFPCRGSRSAPEQQP